MGDSGMTPTEAKSLQALDSKANRLPQPGVGVSCVCGSVAVSIVEVDSAFGTLRCDKCGVEFSGIGWTIRVAEVETGKDAATYPRTADDVCECLTDEKDVKALAAVVTSAKLAVKPETKARLDAATKEVVR